MKKFKNLFEQHREVGRFKPVKPHVVKPIGPRPEVDSAVAKVNEEDELNKKTPSVEDIAKKHGVSVSDAEDMIAKGTKVEMEHTKEKKVAREIAMDHIAEKPDYYKKLKKYVESTEMIKEKTGILKTIKRYVTGKDAGSRAYQELDKMHKAQQFGTPKTDVPKHFNRFKKFQALRGAPIRQESKIEEGSVQDKLSAQHQAIRKKSGLPHPNYYKEIGKSYDIENDEERAKKQAEIRAKYGQHREEVEHLEEMPGANMDTRAVHQHLKKQGWKLSRTSGGHDVFTHPDASHHIAVPRHRQLKAPLVKGILKQSKVNEETEVEKNSAAARTYKDKPEKEPMPKLKEDLRKWFDPKHPEGGWKRINSKGEAVGPCAREPGEGKPKCMSNEKRASLTKKERAAAVRSKRKHDPDPERKGEPINVSNYGKGKISEDIEQLDEKNVPTSPEKWAKAKAQAKAKFDVYPSAYANGWAAKKYKEMGGEWKSVNEEKDDVGEMIKDKLKIIINRAQEMHDGIDGKSEMPEWVKSKITLAQDYISTACDYSCGKEQLGEESDNLQEGRPSQRHPLEGHEYHKKSNQELIGIAKDAHAAAEAMKGHSPQAENKYRDQANDSATVRYFRQKNGMPDWYKKKYGHMKEENSSLKAVAKNALNRQVSEMKTFKESLQESRKAEIVKDIMKKKKETKASEDKFQPDPILTSQIVKEDK